jgi:hypothetical protein
VQGGRGAELGEKVRVPSCCFCVRWLTLVLSAESVRAERTSATTSGLPTATTTSTDSPKATSRLSATHRMPSAAPFLPRLTRAPSDDNDADTAPSSPRRPGARVTPPFVFANDLSRGLVHAAQTALGIAFMLVAMCVLHSPVAALSLSSSLTRGHLVWQDVPDRLPTRAHRRRGRRRGAVWSVRERCGAFGMMTTRGFRVACIFYLGFVYLMVAIDSCLKLLYSLYREKTISFFHASYSSAKHYVQTSFT